MLKKRRRRRRQRKFKGIVKQLGPNDFRILGLPRFHWGDFYHWLLTIDWWQLGLLIVGVYLATNTLFAFAYLADENGIANARPGVFIDAFSFSVQTMATIGYGAMYPNSLYAHILVTIEVFLGLIGVAMITGLIFARFSLPTARVLFSRVAIISPFNDVPTLMFRVANERNNFILESQIRVSILLSQEETKEGHKIRRLYDLKLVRSETPVFNFSWMVMHQIDENSPLYGMTRESLEELEPVIIVTLNGMDDTVAQTIHTRYIYSIEQIVWNARFVNVMT
ncbi:MAG: ATP-sensitive inward rectifier potassium channel 10, partial [Okeania sp. SIO2H7]|nr:ATP-sensitive inward rectifier potassium channel 10 [Okeania sp. SIO2H7]